MKVFYMLVFWWLLSEVVDICVRHTVLESCYINWRYVASCRCVFFTCNEMMNFHRWTRAVVVSTSTTLKLVVIKLIWFALSSQFFTFTQPLLTYTYKNTSSFLRKKCESLKKFFLDFSRCEVFKNLLFASPVISLPSQVVSTELTDDGSLSRYAYTFVHLSWQHFSTIDVLCEILLSPEFTTAWAGRTDATKPFVSHIGS